MDALLERTRPFLTLGGTETFLIFQKGIPLREFCAFEVFENEPAFRMLEKEFLRPTADAALEYGYGLLADCMVWRASPDYVVKLGYARDAVARLNAVAVERMRGFVERWRSDRGVAPDDAPIVLMGELGPRGDGYRIQDGAPISPDYAQAYHAYQMGALAVAGADMVGALTMTSAGETIGIVRSARDRNLPILVSPTLETDGTLPDGSSLRSFVDEVDQATDGYPLGYMVNCAHPTHLAPALVSGGPWLDRFVGFRANASCKSHAELDASTELDAGNPAELGRQMHDLRTRHGLHIIGGCCGTDVSHIFAMARLAV